MKSGIAEFPMEIMCIPSYPFPFTYSSSGSNKLWLSVRHFREKSKLNYEVSYS